MARVLVRYFASARAAAQIGEETISAESVADAVSQLRAKHGEPLNSILRHCTLLLDGTQVEDHTRRLTAPTELDVLPPFAGG